jgi:glycosyltransferase involved in cell wall biosynthesis
VDLSVVIPAHNEADNVEELVREIGTALDRVADYEIVLVDDGSTDATWIGRQRSPALLRASGSCGTR